MKVRVSKEREGVENPC
uniref:Uncharacterized protein n=1 Tax=Anguilla anguilla TaxID=7936 RepID=A0A0E9QLE3_ANGAN